MVIGLKCASILIVNCKSLFEQLGALEKWRENSHASNIVCPSLRIAVVAIVSVVVIPYILLHPYNPNYYRQP